MRRPVGGDPVLEKYLLAVDQEANNGLLEEAGVSRPIAAWTGGAWTWTWQVSREPAAELVASVRPYFFPSGTNEAEFKELRVELGGRVWLPENRESVSTVLFFSERLAREDIDNAKADGLAQPLTHAVRLAIVELGQRAEQFPDAQRDRLNWIDRFNQELRSNHSRTGD